ncbi:CMP-N N'-diacetyllegionaminic acid synthase [termite gut metagenome]|uniref:CMP-N N'-diacetyllegionaminic acid synthase n=1 Tax=termite gut metagenome TaxID=433724 RepID=A0A5J4R1L2_9ZZZZ
MKSLAIIPARGGSKRIPRKNIRLFIEKPVIAYSIEAALKSDIFDEVMVSTDDDEIAEMAKKYGAKVPFIRSELNSCDYATTKDVIFEVLDCYKSINIVFDIVCCIYSTAPFVTSERLIEAHQMINNNTCDSVFPIVAFSYPIQRGLEIKQGKVKMVWSEYKNSRSQDLQTIYHDAGQFYFSTIDSFIKNKGFWGEDTNGLILSELEVQDLDTETDWKLAEMKYKLLLNEKNSV